MFGKNKSSEEAQRQAQRDREQSRGPANTNGWSSQAKEKYDSTYNRKK